MHHLFSLRGGEVLSNAPSNLVSDVEMCTPLLPASQHWTSSSKRQKDRNTKRQKGEKTKRQKGRKTKYKDQKESLIL